MLAPARKAPTMKCSPAQSAPKETTASQISAAYQRSLSPRRDISLWNSQAAMAKV